MVDMTESIEVPHNRDKLYNLSKEVCCLEVWMGVQLELYHDAPSQFYVEYERGEDCTDEKWAGFVELFIEDVEPSVLKDGRYYDPLHGGVSLSFDSVDHALEAHRRLTRRIYEETLRERESEPQISKGEYMSRIGKNLTFIDECFKLPGWRAKLEVDKYPHIFLNYDGTLLSHVNSLREEPWTEEKLRESMKALTFNSWKEEDGWVIPFTFSCLEEADEYFTELRSLIESDKEVSTSSETS